MRRRWKALVAAAALALFASFISLLPPHDDGLDWLRKYGGKENRRLDVERSYAAGNPHRKVEMVFFDFDEIPKGLTDEIKNRTTEHVLEDGMMITAELPGGRIISVHRDLKMITVGRNSESSWLERQWAAVRRRLGIY